MKILIDENVYGRIVSELKKRKFDIVPVNENFRGIPDEKVIQLAIEMNSIILTEDSDYGDWIFAYKKKSGGVIYLRYSSIEVFDIANILVRVMEQYRERLYNKFVVITKRKIRIREI